MTRPDEGSEEGAEGFGAPPLAPHERWWQDNPQQDAKLRQWLEQSGDDRDFIGALADANPTVQDVLEVGPGLYLDHERVWSARKQIAYFAVDVTPRFVEDGLARGLRVRQGSIQALPFPDHCVDMAYCRDVLEHLPHHPTALGELLRVARQVVAVRFFRLSPTAQDDVIAFNTVAEARGLHHNTYAQASIEAVLRKLGAERWEWSHYTAHANEPSVGSCWLTIQVPARS